MANTFKTSLAHLVTGSWADVYAAPAAKKSLLLEIDMANTHTDFVTVSVGLASSSATAPSYYLIKDAVIPVGSSLSVVNGQKVCVDATVARYVVAKVTSTAGTSDSIATVLEDVQ